MFKIIYVKPLICGFVFFGLICVPAGLSAKDGAGNGADKAHEALKSNPPAETPSGTTPAEPASPGQNPANPAEPGNPGKPEAPSQPETSSKPDNPSKPDTPTEPSKPADSRKNNTPPEETPSGTKPADPANPGETPANPAEPGDKRAPDADKNAKETDGKEAKDKNDKTDKDSRDKKDKPGKGGKSGGGKGGSSLPSGAPTPSGAAALAPAAGAIGGGIFGSILSGGKEKAEKKEEPERVSEETAVSSKTIKAAEPVQASTQPIIDPLYSAGLGPRIAVMDFDGDTGPEFSALLSSALSGDLKVYSPKELAAKDYDPAAINRVSAKKIAAEIGVEYIVTGKASKKSETLAIISVFLRDGNTGDIKMTNNYNVRFAGDLKSAAVNAGSKIKELCR